VIWKGDLSSSGTWRVVLRTEVMIDLHCHILPGLDDGAVSIDEAILMAKALAEAGYRRVCCTPHCLKGYYEHSPRQVREATLMLQADLDNAGVELELGPGMEYCLDECLKTFADDLLPLGNSCLVLCEAPHHANPYFVIEGLELILSKGFIPLIAHPERSRFFYNILAEIGSHEQSAATADFKQEARPEPQFKPKKIWQRLLPSRAPRPAPGDCEAAPGFEARIPAGCLFQANLGSFTNFYPNGTMQRAYQMLKAGQYHCIASDLHNSAMVEKTLKAGVLKFETNPLLKKLAGRTPADLEQISARMRQAEKNGEQQEFGF
jgi:protein-tyrosine phosphatase